MRFALLIGAALLVAAAAPARPSGGTLVPLQAQPGTPMDKAARALAADDLQDAAAHNDKPLVLIGTAELGGERQALFVQIQSARACGSAGCTTSVYTWTHGAWHRVLDGTTGRLAIAATKTRGMSDLLTDSERYVWTGTSYRSTHPAPAIDLRPRPARRR